MGDLLEFTATSHASVVTTAPRSGAYHLNIDGIMEIGTSSGNVTKVFSSGVAEFWSRLTCRTEDIVNVTTDQFVFYWKNDAAGDQGYMELIKSGGLWYLRAVWGTYNSGLVGPVDFDFAEWHLIEVHAKIGIGVDDELDVKFDGLSKIDANGDWTITISDIDWFRWYAAFSNLTPNQGTGYFDDLALNDASGDVNNGWVGDGKIFRLRPTGVGTFETMDAFPDTGEDNYEDVDEVPHDGDTTYVYKSTQAYDSYLLSNVPSPPAGYTYIPNCVVVKSRAKTLSAGQGQIRGRIRVDSSFYSGSYQDLVISYAAHSWTWDENPLTSDPWTVALVNALQAGQEVT